MRAAANEESKVLAENSKRTVTAIGELLAQMEAVRTSWSNSGKEFEASMRSAASQVRADVERVMKDAVANAPKAVVRDPLDGIQPVPFKRPRWVSLRYRVDLTGLFSRKNRQEHEDTPDSFTDTAPIEKPDTSFDKSDPFGERVQKQGLTRFVKRLFSRKSDG